MMIVEILFYVFAVLAIISAGVILFTNNLLYAAFSLVACFLCVAAIYVIAQAEFVAITQIMIYVGGIVVLLIFGVMLTNKISGRSAVTLSHNKFITFLLSGALFVLLFFGIIKMNFHVSNETGPGNNNVEQLGIGLMTDYILPFEMTAVILLVALIGALTIAGYKNTSDEH